MIRSICYGQPRPLVVDTPAYIVRCWLSSPARETDSSSRPLELRAVEPSARRRQATARPATSARRSSNPRLWGVLIVRNAADILRTHVLHHLSLGMEKLVIADDQSEDGTDLIADRLSSDPRWNGVAFRDHSICRLRTSLAREAFDWGATWGVFPLDVVEFWVTSLTDLRPVLEVSDAAALACAVVNLIQQTSVRERSQCSLLSLTRRALHPIGPPNARTQSAVGSIVLMEAPRKWIGRAGPHLSVSRWNHRVSGVAGPHIFSSLVTCLRAPVRARSVIREQQTEAQRLLESGCSHDISREARHSRRLQDAAAVDLEWEANSHDDSKSGGQLQGVPLIEDRRLHDIAARWSQNPILRSRLRRR